MTLLIMAAGLGSRFGGDVKQIAPVDAEDNLIIDYSIFDAMVAGFDKVVFVINRKIEQAFCDKIFNRIKSKIDAKYVFQDMDDLPGGYKTPETRVKPWGTVQAILAARDIIDEPFCVINADDFYGRDAFVKAAQFFKNNSTTGQYTTVAYELDKTCPEKGAVNRGVCQFDKNKMLVKVTECHNIERRDGVIGYPDGDNFVVLSDKTNVSMNFLGLKPDVMPLLQDKFENFLKSNIHEAKAEYIIVTALDELVSEGKVSIKMQTAQDEWFGFTYKDDMPVVLGKVQKLIENKIYPSPLWSKQPKGTDFAAYLAEHLQQVLV